MLSDEVLSQLKDISFVFSSISFHQSELHWKVISRNKHQLLFINRGKGQLTIDGQHFHAETGDAFFLAPGKTIEGQSADSELLQFYVTEYAYELKKHEMAASIFPQKISVRNTASLINLHEQMIDKQGSLNPLKQWRQRILFQELLYSIIADMQLQTESGEMSAVIQRIVSYINEHFTENISVKSLAALFGLSPTNFSKIFKTHSGMKPIEYITLLRMKRAKDLLIAKQRLKTVARSVGYNDELYFSRIFKKTVGVPPTIYVKKPYKRIATLNSTLNDYLLTLGVQPVATLFYEGKSQVNGHLPYIANKMPKTKVIDSKVEHKYEAIMEVCPDLIMGVERKETSLTEWKKIAPLLQTGIEDDWKGLLLEISHLIGRDDIAKNWLNDFERTVLHAKYKLSKAVTPEETVMVLIATEKGLRIYGGKRQMGAILYKELQLTPPRGIDLNTHYLYTTYSELAYLNPDHIFLSTWAHNSCEKEVRNLKTSDAWKSLRAVQHQRVYEIDHWFNLHSPLNNSLIISKTLECLLQDS